MIARQRLIVRGLVQGVGFRPFVYRLAQELALSGWVRNDGMGVSIEAEGDPEQLAVLERRLHEDLPPQAKIDSVQLEEMPPAGSASQAFFIARNSLQEGAQLDAVIGPDMAICSRCLGELLDPADRRYRYAFINCTDCGPRYTIAHRLPYARVATSMAEFVQCAACQSEYADPSHHRFHAEPNACPACGPKLDFLDQDGRVVEGDAIAIALARLQRGEIIAIKGLGGFHLACDARQPQAVARLRERKQREEKPLALMFANAASITPYASMTVAESKQLAAPERPVVLLHKQGDCDAAFPEVAPDIAWLGAMLPYTPLHYLLFHEAAERPLGKDWLSKPQQLALVMTSANPHGEPLVTQNDEAITRLSGIADAYLLHDRGIVTRCDDSVLRLGSDQGAPHFIRRARGFTPRAIKLAQTGPDVLALGAMLNNTLCFTRNGEALLSSHIGDLDRVAACLALEETVDSLRHILEVSPRAVAHDLHPDFFSTRLTYKLAETWGVPTVAVQHHHAHIAAVLAEHGREEPVLGLALDGYGLGEDGTAWGGELFEVGGGRFERIGHLRTLALPGGDQAAREPWRMAASALHMLGRGEEISQRFADHPSAAMVAQMLAENIRSPETSSMGRWFDAAVGLLGIQARMSFEGQAAMRLEGLAAAYGDITAPALHEIRLDDDRLILDLAPLLQSISEQRDAARGAALFHAALIAALADWVAQAAQAKGLHVVACGGGCFQNVILARGLRRTLKRRGITMLEAQAVPPGDGGLSLGQAWVARARMNGQ